MKMTSKIGSKTLPLFSFRRNPQGFTFVEVMVTLVVLSVGITAIMKTYIYSLDRMNYLSNRVYATLLIDNHVAKIERILKVYNALPMTLPPNQEIDQGGKKLDFKQEMQISAVEDQQDVFQLIVRGQWIEGERPKNIFRIAYLADFGQ